MNLGLIRANTDEYQIIDSDNIDPVNHSRDIYNPNVAPIPDKKMEEGSDTGSPVSDDLSTGPPIVDSLPNSLSIGGFSTKQLAIAGGGLVALGLVVWFLRD